MNKLFKKIASVFMAGAIAATMAVTAFAAEEAPEEPKVNTDKVVWVGGKDVKASKDGKTPATLYKTESVQAESKYTGGKWMVAVAKSDVTTADAFVKLFDEKGKFTGGAETKDIAKAKIKDGVVTVTAGKKAGEVTVWVYEVNSKKVVNTDTVKPFMPFEEAITVKQAPTALALSDKEGTKGKVTAVKAVEVEEGKSVDLYVGDTKAEVVVKDLSIAEATKADTTAKVAYSAETGKLTVTGVKEGTTEVSVTCVQSGKTAKVKVKVKAAEKAADPETT